MQPGAIRGDGGIGEHDVANPLIPSRAGECLGRPPSGQTGAGGRAVAGSDSRVLLIISSLVAGIPPDIVTKDLELLEDRVSDVVVGGVSRVGRGRTGGAVPRLGDGRPVGACGGAADGRFEPLALEPLPGFGQERAVALELFQSGPPLLLAPPRPAPAGGAVPPRTRAIRCWSLRSSSGGRPAGAAALAPSPPVGPAVVQGIHGLAPGPGSRRSRRPARSSASGQGQGPRSWPHGSLPSFRLSSCVRVKATSVRQPRSSIVSHGRTS